MGAADLLLHLRDLGLTLSCSVETLIVAPRSLITDDVRAVIHQHKAVLIGHLLAERLATAINTATLARGDTEANRRELLAEALALPAAKQLDLAEHFEDVARIWQAACRGVMP